MRARSGGPRWWLAALAGGAAVIGLGWAVDDGSRPGPGLAAQGKADVVVVASPAVDEGRDKGSARPQFVVECRQPATQTAGDYHVFGPPLSECNQAGDRSQYAIPAVGGEWAPTQAAATYRPGPGVDAAWIRPMPAGLELTAVGEWRCGSLRATPGPEACSGNATATFEVRFPDCWDGVSLTRPDGAHALPSSEGRCPASHPVHIPQLVVTASYPSSAGGGLSTRPGDPVGSPAEAPARGHFTNGWDPEKLRTEVAACLHRQVTCGLASPHPAVDR